MTYTKVPCPPSRVARRGHDVLLDHLSEAMVVASYRKVPRAEARRRRRRAVEVLVPLDRRGPRSAHPELAQRTLARCCIESRPPRSSGRGLRQHVQDGARPNDGLRAGRSSGVAPWRAGRILSDLGVAWASGRCGWSGLGVGAVGGRVGSIVTRHTAARATIRAARVTSRLSRGPLTFYDYRRSVAPQEAAMGPALERRIASRGVSSEGRGGAGGAGRTVVPRAGGVRG